MLVKSVNKQGNFALNIISVSQYVQSTKLSEPESFA